MKPGVLVLLMSATAIAGEADIVDTFTIKAPLTRVVEWVDAHAADLRAVCNIELLGQDEDGIKLRRQNNRGTWVWTQREEIERGDGTWKMRTELVECVEGGIERLGGTVTMTGDGQETRVRYESHATVDTVKSRDLEFDLKAKGRRIRNLMQESIR